MTKRQQDSNLAVLCRCYDTFTADLIRGVLEAGDIPCFLHGYHHTSVASYLPMNVNIIVKVLDSDLEAAKALLQDIENN